MGLPGGSGEDWEPLGRGPGERMDPESEGPDLSLSSAIDELCDLRKWSCLSKHQFLELKNEDDKSQHALHRL